ncbi:hypothetical protein VTI28DRAFT_9421 [Corynascus sepedonium]
MDGPLQGVDASKLGCSRGRWLKSDLDSFKVSPPHADAFNDGAHQICSPFVDKPSHSQVSHYDIVQQLKG